MRSLGKRWVAIVCMVFAILNSKGSAVKDPDSGEVLGSVPLPKVFVRVSMVQNRLSLARTFRSIVRGGTVAIPSIFTAGTMDVETLRKQDHSESAELDEKDSIVRRGDPAVQVLNPEELESS